MAQGRHCRQKRACLAPCAALSVMKMRNLYSKLLYKCATTFIRVPLLANMNGARTQWSVGSETHFDPLETVPEPSTESLPWPVHSSIFSGRHRSRASALMQICLLGSVYTCPSTGTAVGACALCTTAACQCTVCSRYFWPLTCAIGALTGHACRRAYRHWPLSIGKYSLDMNKSKGTSWLVGIKGCPTIHT